MQVIVQGLPFAYAWQDLKDLFNPIGGVLQADIVMGRDGRSKGWGTLNFETEADAERAIQVNTCCSLQTTGRQHQPCPFPLSCCHAVIVSWLVLSASGVGPYLC